MLSAISSVVWSKKSTIFRVALLNTVLTFSSEVITRTFLGLSDASLYFYSHLSGFNNQSLISIFSSFFITILGAPTWYIESTRVRYWLFVSLGIAVSLLGQYCTSLLLHSELRIISTRLYFDVAYLTTMKFLFFEWKRKIISSSETSTGKVFIARLQQDSVSAMVKNVMLSLIGLKN